VEGDPVSEADIEPIRRGAFLAEVRSALVECGDANELILAFTKAVDARLAKGHEEYAGASFKRPFSAVLDELQQEELDRAGWAYILWTKASAECSRLGITLHDRHPAVAVAREATAVACLAFTAWARNEAAMRDECSVLDAWRS
jgi:hypothetical protein